jgi:peptidyl-prolyl cis-trans isomerase B (cyclophilin B)
MKLATNCGDIVIEMDAAKAPKTTQSMAFLAAQGFYTDADCFRLTVTGLFVLQCGSPTNDGQGGPGYSLPDENLPAAGANNYPAGTVAMANAGPGTAGSQFFIVYKDTTLGPDYTIWGKVVSGLDVVQNVAAGGVQTGAGAPAPNQKTVITKATTGTTLAG